MLLLLVFHRLDVVVFVFRLAFVLLVAKYAVVSSVAHSGSLLGARRLAQAAPLLMGNDLRRLAPEMKSILLNEEVIAVDQVCSHPALLT